jgi:hypothetical protein
VLTGDNGADPATAWVRPSATRVSFGNSYHLEGGSK